MKRAFHCASRPFILVLFIGAVGIGFFPTMVLGEQVPSFDPWGPLVELRDNTEKTIQEKPKGGWWVTPIHATLQPSGKVLITGWGRRDQSDCTAGGYQRHGRTFLLDPHELVGGTMNIVPLDEQGSPPGDVLFCGGHAPLPDGRLLYVGGQRHGTPDMGLNYGRVYQPTDNSFVRINEPMSGGPEGEAGMRWYPTATRLADSRVLVTGGFVREGKSEFGNRSIELFDQHQYDAGRRPWELLLSHKEGLGAMIPGVHDYTHVYFLPKPVLGQGELSQERQIVMFGGEGTMLLFHHANNLSGSDRFFIPPHGQRQGRGDGSTGSLLPTGEILVLGGTEGPRSSQRADFYSPYSDKWRSVDTGIGRWHASSVLLPDGTVLIVNGESRPGFVGDPRQPQTIDPISHRVQTWPAWSEDSRVRGYHNVALLLKDGRVLLGGGVDPGHFGVACERPDVQIYSPPYLWKGARPRLLNVEEPLFLTVGGSSVLLNYDNGMIRKGTGVVLMAVGSMTHAFDQNQRYVPLEFTLPKPGVLKVFPPTKYQQAPAGSYFLFLVNEAGTPSEGIFVHLK